MMLRKLYVGAAILFLPLCFASNTVAQAPRNACTQFDQTFKIYFESNSAAVASIGEKIVEQALANTAGKPTCAISHVTIEGFTDTAGTDEKNMFLSHAMALNLKDVLIDQGVDKRLVSTAGRGETMQSKATRDNVREPLNRRVEVHIHLAPK